MEEVSLNIGTKLLIPIFSMYGTNIIFGLIVGPLIYKDATKLEKLFLNSKAWLWAVAPVLFGPFWVLLVYWAIHHSTLSNRLNGESS